MPSRAAMALSASAWFVRVTNPNPRLRPDSLSFTTVMSLAEKSANMSPREASSTPHERFPTYSLTGPSVAPAESPPSSSMDMAVKWNARTTVALDCATPETARPPKERAGTTTRAKAGTLLRDALHTAAFAARPPTDAVMGLVRRARAFVSVKAAIFLDIKWHAGVSEARV